MGKYLTKTAFLVQLLHLLISSSCGEPSENGVCISKGGRFEPYESEGKPPKSGDREFKELNMCKAFHGKTCCSASQMQSASSALKNLSTYGEATKDCSDLFELLECSICNSNVGIQSGPPRICASFCDRVFQACSDAYFSSEASKKVIVPCGNEDIICGKASKWESNGTAFCDAMGFTVQREEPCYGSKASLEPVMEPGSSEERTPKLVVWFQDLKPPVREMITWTVIVTACFLYRGFIDIDDLRAVRLRADRNGNA